MRPVQTPAGFRPAHRPAGAEATCSHRGQPLRAALTLTLNAATQEAQFGNRIIRVSRREFRVLKALAAAYPRLMTVAELIAADTPSMRIAIHSLRPKVAVLGFEITNLRGCGYALRELRT